MRLSAECKDRVKTTVPARAAANVQGTGGLAAPPQGATDSGILWSPAARRASLSNDESQVQFRVPQMELVPLGRVHLA